MKQHHYRLSCPNCNEEFNALLDDDQYVRCPKCKTPWRTQIQLRAVPFRCGKMGEKFEGVFVRTANGKKFQFLRAEKGTRELASPNPNPQRGLLDLIFRRKPTSDPEETTIARIENFDIKEFEFVDWNCPYCGWGKTDRHPRKANFFRCIGCQGLICGGVINLENGGVPVGYCPCGHTNILNATITHMPGSSAAVSESQGAPLENTTPQNPSRLLTEGSSLTRR